VSGGAGGGGALHEGAKAGGGARTTFPATFTISAGGNLNPTGVSSPAGAAIELVVSSDDGQQHHVLLRTPTIQPLTVPAHSRASILIRSLRPGRYVVDLDGLARGLLLVGGGPRP
jgi:hypothetical protein